MRAVGQAGVMAICGSSQRQGWQISPTVCQARPSSSDVPGFARQRSVTLSICQVLTGPWALMTVVKLRQYRRRPIASRFQRLRQPLPFKGILRFAYTSVPAPGADEGGATNKPSGATV